MSNNNLDDRIKYIITRTNFLSENRVNFTYDEILLFIRNTFKLGYDTLTFNTIEQMIKHKDLTISRFNFIKNNGNEFSIDEIQLYLRKIPERNGIVTKIILNIQHVPSFKKTQFILKNDIKSDYDKPTFNEHRYPYSFCVNELIGKTTIRNIFSNPDSNVENKLICSFYDEYYTSSSYNKSDTISIRP